jgi:hypothetical protein
MNRPFRILSLDGGGIKGAFAASALATFERATGQRFVEHCDVARRWTVQTGNPRAVRAERRTKQHAADGWLLHRGVSSSRSGFRNFPGHEYQA